MKGTVPVCISCLWRSDHVDMKPSAFIASEKTIEPCFICGKHVFEMVNRLIEVDVRLVRLNNELIPATEL